MLPLLNLTDNEYLPNILPGLFCARIEPFLIFWTILPVLPGSHDLLALAAFSKNIQKHYRKVQYETNLRWHISGKSNTGGTIMSDNDFLKSLYTNLSERMAANPNMSVPDLRALFLEWEAATLEPEDVCYASGRVGGIDGIWVYPANGDRKRVLLYTHGGGFVVGAATTHRKVAGHVAKALGITAFVADYRLAPEHPFPAQVEDAVAVFCGLLASGIKANDIATIGDSAGGNLAVATVLQLRQLGEQTPGCVIAFSPWTDMEMTGQTLETNAATDALVQKPVLEGMRAMFLGENTAANDPIASPLLSDYEDFPPLYINAGSVETLLDDSVRLHEKATAQGVDSTLSVVEGMQHVFPFLAGRDAAADDEINRIADWYRQRQSA